MSNENNENTVVDNTANVDVEENKKPENVEENQNKDNPPANDMADNVKEDEGNKEDKPTQNQVEQKQTQVQTTKKLDMTPEQIAAVDSPDKAAAVIKEFNFDYNELQKEFNENGDITKETRAKLAEAGISGEMVDNFIAGQKARLERDINFLANEFGGMANFQQLCVWATKNLSEEEVASINSLKDVNLIKMVMGDVKRRMEEKEGVLPQFTRGGGASTSSDLYESKAQVIADMQSKEYKTDEVFRAKVAKKLKASTEAGKFYI